MAAQREHHSLHSVPEDARTTRLPPSRAFVGRDDALAAISAALEPGPALVLVEGEAGIGKSRLVREFLQSAAAEALRTLVAVCPPFRESLTLGPIVDAVRQAQPSIANLQLSPLAGALRPVFPEWAAGLPPSPEPLDDAKAARHRLLSALAELIEHAGSEVLVVEDAHWADEATMEFLLLLTSRERRPSLIVTYRSEDVPAGSLLRRLSSRVPAGVTHTRLRLEPLDLAATASLVSSMLDGGPVSDEFADFVHQHTDGLPLLVEESVRLLHDRADLIRRDGHWVRRDLDEMQVPPTVREAVIERRDRLSEDARGVLEAAAVFGEPVDQTTVSQVAGLPSERAQRALIDVLASGLLVEVGRQNVAFHHDLLGRAVYEAIAGLERRRLHLSAGQALEEVRPRPLVQLTRHFREASDVDRWCKYAEQTAELAVADGDHTTATVLLNDVLTTVPLLPSDRARLARKLAHAALYRGDAVSDLDREVARTLHDVLESPGLSRREQAEIRSPLGRLLIWLGEFGVARRELEQAVPDLDHDPGESARVMIHLGLPVIGPSPASVHLQWLRRAARIDVGGLSSADRLVLTGLRAAALLLLGEEEGWAVAAELPAEPLRADEQRHLARALYNIVPVAVLWGRYADAREWLAVASALADDQSLPRIHSGVVVSQAQLDWLTGSWDGLAERLVSLAAMEDLDPQGHVFATCIAGLLQLAHGRRRDAEEHFVRALDEDRQLGGAHFDALDAVAGLAGLRLGEGDFGAALQVTDGPVQMVVTKGIWIWATEIAPPRVEALVAAGEVDDADRLVAMFARGLRGRTAPAPRAALALCRANLAQGRGDRQRAAAAFARAARAWEQLPRPRDALLARERQAQCLLAVDNAEAGFALLSEVYEGLYDLGAYGDADRVAQRLREQGGEVPRLWRGGTKGYGDELSPRELDVVRLVAAGKTNPEIARVLCKSPKTVAVQLRSAMRKLGVASRTAVAVAAMEADLVPGAGGRNDRTEQGVRPTA